MFQKEVYLLTIYFLITVSLSEYHNQLNTNDKSIICESTRDASLVEHFFNLIFAEFHNTPQCTCVKMCKDQPIYCYPSGCMPIITKKPIRTHIQREDKRVTLVIKDHNTTSFSNLLDDSQHINTGVPENGAINNYLPSILENRYKTLIQYKKKPKVELKYNFRTKMSLMSNIGSKVISKGRWPNRQNTVSISEKLIAKINSAKLTSTIHPTKLPRSPTRMNTKYKRENKENNSLEDY